MERWRSRKFLVTVATQAAALAVLMFPEHEGVIEAWVQTLVPMAVMLLSALGYVTAEASVDRARAGEGPSSPATSFGSS